MDTEVSPWLPCYVRIFNSTMHKLHSSTQAKHTCHNCLSSDAVYFDILKIQVQINSSRPKLFVCFPIDIIDIIQHSQESRINTFRQTNGCERESW